MAKIASVLPVPPQQIQKTESKKETSVLNGRNVAIGSGVVGAALVGTFTACTLCGYGFDDVQRDAGDVGGLIAKIPENIGGGAASVGTAVQTFVTSFFGNSTNITNIADSVNITNITDSANITGSDDIVNVIISTE